MKKGDNRLINRTKFLAAAFTFSGLFTLTAGNPMAEGILPPHIVFDGAGESVESLSYFETVYRGPVSFTHGKHVKEYKLECGQCHHDDSGEPLADLTPGEEINRCIDCHDKDGLIRGRAPDVSQEEILKHYPNAMHQMCIGCHWGQNNRTHSMNAPEACRGCHAKTGG